uniref:Uncharacterized protein n=1 Tax=Plectus sambesii TaxID=2011161 RepID=A0A914W7I4_9BILA
MSDAQTLLGEGALETTPGKDSNSPLGDLLILHKNDQVQDKLNRFTFRARYILVCTAIRSVRLGGCPAEWRGPLLWPVVAMRLWAMVDATGENRPACREGLSPIYLQLSCYQFPDPQRDEHLGWVRVALSGN